MGVQVRLVLGASSLRLFPGILARVDPGPTVLLRLSQVRAVGAWPPPGPQDRLQVLVLRLRMAGVGTRCHCLRVVDMLLVLLPV